MVIISADAEWKALTTLLSQPGISIFGKKEDTRGQSHFGGKTPFGEWLTLPVGGEEVLFLQGGWGKISAAASAQYAIDRWKPELLVNLGTCGGFEGEIEPGILLVVERTLVYDILEQMGDSSQAIAHYTTPLDTAWLGKTLPSGLQRSLLVSADRDLVANEIQDLKEKYGAIAGDWESGAIAWVAGRNQVACLILRGVTDLVGAETGEAYGNYDLFAQRTGEIMARLMGILPQVLRLYLNR